MYFWKVEIIDESGYHSHDVLVSSDHTLELIKWLRKLPRDDSRINLLQASELAKRLLAVAGTGMDPCPDWLTVTTYHRADQISSYCSVKVTFTVPWFTVI